MANSCENGGDKNKIEIKLVNAKQTIINTCKNIWNQPATKINAKGTNAVMYLI